MDDSFVMLPGVRRLTVNVDANDVGLFRGLWPVPEGVALHSYLVEGDRAVLIDPWFDGGFGAEELGLDLDAAGRPWSSVAAVAVTEPLSQEAMADLRRWAPHVELWGLPTPGTRHDLGQGLSLVESDGFWVVEPHRLVLTGTVMAGLGWIEDEVWGETLDEGPRRWFDAEAQRWFALRPEVPARWPEGGRVAPRHGLAWTDGERAVARVRTWVEWAHGPALDSLCLIWPASDRDRIDALVGGALDEGIDIEVFDPADDGAAVAAAARRSTLIVATPGAPSQAWSSLQKSVWVPPPDQAPAALRAEVSSRWKQAAAG